MKLLQSIFVSGFLTNRILAPDAAEITAVSARFSAPTGDEQYQARLELDRLVDQATLPGKGDSAAVTKILVQALQAPGTPFEAKKYLLRALCRVGTDDALAVLTPLLADKEALLREKFRFALASSPVQQAVAALQAELTNTTDPHHKLGLINSPGTCKAESSVAALTPMLGDSDPEIAAAAINSLAEIGGTKATEVHEIALGSAKVASAQKSSIEL